MCIRQTITDKIINLMEAGTKATGPRWTGGTAGGLPRNARTGEPYHGINILLLWAVAAERHYATNQWLTYKQAEALGAQVRKGEKSVMCAYFSKVQTTVKEQKDDAEAAGTYMLCKSFWLFNVAQIDGLPALREEPTTATPITAIEEAEQLLTASGADIRHGFDGAFYAPAKDQICLPDRQRFTSAENYYATALHELAHWTGHASRFNRQFGKRFGDDAYAVEELVAELGAAFLVGQLGMVDATIESHASYLASWIKVLKNDKQAIFTAASAASKAADFVLQSCTAPAYCSGPVKFKQRIEPDGPGSSS
jgi:antirestriction protein ArdC